jgi:hypothetical protein
VSFKEEIMKKIFAIILTLTILCLCAVGVSAEATDTSAVDTSIESVVTEDIAPETSLETEPALEPEISTDAEIIPEDSDNTPIPAVEHIINFFFDGKITVSQIVEYLTVALTAILSFAYNKYKRKSLIKDKAISKTDLEIESLKKKDQDMANQVGLLGNMIVCAYLSNNLIDPELKKKLAVYAEELMKNTTLNKDTLTEKLILAAQNPNYQAKITELKDNIAKEAEQNQETIDNLKGDITALSDALNQESPSTQASDVIDNLKIGG